MLLPVNYKLISKSALKCIHPLSKLDKTCCIRFTDNLDVIVYACSMAYIASVKITTKPCAYHVATQHERACQCAVTRRGVTLTNSWGYNVHVC